MYFSGPVSMKRDLKKWDIQSKWPISLESSLGSALSKNYLMTHSRLLAFIVVVIVKNKLPWAYEI